jgi:Peptidase family M28/Fibronectin type III domain
MFTGATRRAVRVLTGGRRWVLTAVVLAGVVATALVAVAVASQDAGNGMPKWWTPPAEVRAMLRQISPANLKAADSRLVQFGTRHTSSSQTDPVRGVGAAAAWITSQLQAIAATSGGAMTVQRQTFVQPVSPNIPVPTTITNVIATLKGTASPERFYVVGAHYDDRVTDVLDFTSDAPGADRDGSGVAAMLELARVFAAHPASGTIQFVAFAGEEQGLYGSRFFAQQHAAAGDDVQGALNLDTIGSPLGDNGVYEPHTVRVFSEGVPTNATSNQVSLLQAFGGEDDSVSRQLARYIQETGQNDATGMDVQLVFRRDRILRGSDQVSFSAQGYPAVRFAEPNENYNHEAQNVQVVNGVQLGDLLQFVHFNYLARVTRVVGSTLAALADSPGTPKNVQQHTTPPVNFAGSNNVRLSWNANTEPNLVGYEVVWRDTSDPNWTHALRVGNVTSVTLTGMNPDNFYFGVRALDSQGRRSPVAFPAPVS